MSAANKAKGTRWETQIEDYLNDNGLKARRLPRAGSKDIGDVAITTEDLVIVIEAKNVKAADMAEFLRQADTEAVNYADKYDCKALPIVITKTRQKGPGMGRVVMYLDTFIELMYEVG